MCSNSGAYAAILEQAQEQGGSVCSNVGACTTKINHKIARPLPYPHGFRLRFDIEITLGRSWNVFYEKFLDALYKKNSKSRVDIERIQAFCFPGFGFFVKAWPGGVFSLLDMHTMNTVEVVVHGWMIGKWVGGWTGCYILPPSMFFILN